MSKVELQKVNEVAANVAGAGRTLHAYAIDPSNRLTLRQAATAVGANSDEILAVMEMRARRAARRAAPVAAPAAHEEELELV
jgi:hypothetical protein